MFALAAGKACTGRALGNPVLRTESRVTLIDGILATAVLLGLVLNATLGWWADPAAGYMLVFYAAREVREIFFAPDSASPPRKQTGRPPVRVRPVRDLLRDHIGAALGNRTPDLRITSVSRCVATGVGTLPTLRLAGCRCWRSLAVHGPSGAPRGHGFVPVAYGRRTRLSAVLGHIGATALDDIDQALSHQHAHSLAGSLPRDPIALHQR
jgi:hypothetical protein